MKERLRLYLQFIVWVLWRKKTIRNKQGNVVCPLMIKYGTRFNDKVILCDIPHTRTYFCMGKEKPCAMWKNCIPRKECADKASDELNCRPTYAPRESLHFRY